MLRRRPPRLPEVLEPPNSAGGRSPGLAGLPDSTRGRRDVSARGRAGLARSGRRRVARRNRVRRWAAALLAAVAGFVTVSALTPRGAAAPGIVTVVAARDLAAGAVLEAGDLLVEARPPAQRPDTALARPDELIGKVLAAPLAAREVVTSARLRGAGMLAGQPAGTVAMSVPVLDPGATGVAPGSRVDLYASSSGEAVARDVIVLAIRQKSGSEWGPAAGASITLGLNDAAAAKVAGASSALQTGEIFIVALHHVGR